MPGKRTIRRRDVLKGTATGLAAAALPSLMTRPLRADEDKLPPNERIGLGFIGTGDLGTRHHLRNKILNDPVLYRQVDLVGLCDVDRNRVDEAARSVFEKSGRRVATYKDYRQLLERKDLDAVFVVTPDHWHATAAIAAIEAGLDVYCEKPLTLTIEEGRRLSNAATRYGTVFQTGSQQRSNDRFRLACELVRNGKIGAIERVDTVLHGVSPGTWIPEQTPPDHFDWNMWLGPAPYRPYRPNLVHYQFRWQFDFSGGVMTDWGAHHNDIAQWALGMDESGPVYVDGTKAEFSMDGPHDVALKFDVHYKYANGVDLYCHTDKQDYPDGTSFGNGVKFTGKDGWVFVSRGEIQASDPDLLKTEFGPDDVRLYDSPNHHYNWFECMRTRKNPICHAEVGHRSVTVCHLGNISMRLRRPLKWDPDKEQFIDDAQANAMVRKPKRAPWHL